jgi:GntR family transcriptional regulator
MGRSISIVSISINRRSRVPLYYQIQQSLLKRITAGKFKTGDLLPSEQEISARLGISRMTARQALKSLCHLGVTYSRRGKGTFVSGIKLEKNFRQVQSFTEEMKARGLKPQARVLSFQTIPARGEVAEALKLPLGEPVVSLRRLRLADSCPMGIECSHLPARICPGILKAFNPRNSLYQALWKRYGILMAVAEEVVEVGRVSAEEARLLHTRPGSPVFQFTRTSYLQDGRPVEYVKSIYRGDRYKIVTRLMRLNRDFEMEAVRRT